MNKLHSIAFYALIAPAITLSSAAVLAQQSSGQDSDREQQSSQAERDSTLTTGQDLDREQDRSQRQDSTTRNTPLTSRDSQSPDRAGQSDSQQTAAERRNMRDGQSRMENRGFMNSAPANGVHISDLMGADVSTTGDEDVGSVDDLIIDENGQIVAIVVGVGGFLGMGQKDVAIGWDDVTRSGDADSDDVELRIDSTREELRDAPEFESEE